MAIRRWPKFPPGTPFDVVRVELDAWMRENDARIVGGDRAHTALDSAAELTTNVKGSATIAGKPAGGVAAVYATDFMETFDAVPSEWTVLSGTRNATLAGTGETGGKALRQTGPVSLEFPYASLPYDATKAHRLRAKVKRVSGSGTFSFGVRAYNAAGTLLGTYPVAADAASPSTGSYDTFTGWVQGTGTPSTPAPNADAPSPLPVGTATIRPYYALNTGDGSGVTDLDVISYDRLDEEATARLYETLLPSDDPARLATGAGLQDDTVHTPAVQDLAITEPKHDDDSVSTRVIQADVAIVGKVYSSDDPTIFLDLRTGLAPTDLVFSHPAFALYFDGTAVFTGEVAAASFTASLATFNGTIQADRMTVVKTFVVSGTGVPGTATSLTGNLKVQTGTFEFSAGILWVRSNCDLQVDGTFTAAALTLSGALAGTTATLTSAAIGTVTGATVTITGVMTSNSVSTVSVSTSGLTVTGTLNHTGGFLKLYNGTLVSKHANQADTSGATLAALEAEVNALKAILRYYNLM